MNALTDMSLQQQVTALIIPTVKSMMKSLL
jgi:hypothetical protein